MWSINGFSFQFSKNIRKYLKNKICLTILKEKQKKRTKLIRLKKFLFCMRKLLFSIFNILKSFFSAIEFSHDEKNVNFMNILFLSLQSIIVFVQIGTFHFKLTTDFFLLFWLKILSDKNKGSLFLSLIFCMKSNCCCNNLFLLEIDVKHC